MISVVGEDPQYYYDPLNIKVVKRGVNSVPYMINYTDDEGELKSLLGSSIFDCSRRLIQEQSSVLYKGHWAAGSIIDKLGPEAEWRQLKVRSDGMKLLEIACR